MFRVMRREKQQLPESEALDILKNSTTCTLALSGDNGYTYSLPINYAYIYGNIYFHCAKQGHKIDAIRQNNKISLSIIANDEIISEKFTDKYKSVIVFGDAQILEDENEIKSVCKVLAKKLCPDESIQNIIEETEKFKNQTAVVKIVPRHITGKEGLEFYKLRSK